MLCNKCGHSVDEHYIGDEFGCTRLGCGCGGFVPPPDIDEYPEEQQLVMRTAVNPKNPMGRG